MALGGDFLPWSSGFKRGFYCSACFTPRCFDVTLFMTPMFLGSLVVRYVDL